MSAGARHAHLPTAMLLRLAWRNLWRHRRRTLITLASIAFGFGLAILFIGIGDGGHNSMVRNAISLGEGHLTVQPPDHLVAPANHKYLADGERIERTLDRLDIEGHVDPRISLQVLASTARNSVPAGLEGLDPVTDHRTAILSPRLVAGIWLERDDARGIVIGDGMASRLEADIGTRVVLMAGDQTGNSQAQLGRVRGIFDSGVDELDNFLVLADISLARHFLVGEGAEAEQKPVTRFAVFLDDPDAMATWKPRVAEALADEPVAVLDWQEMMPQLVQFILIDDAGNYVFLLLILVMVIFGILNTVLMSVLERTREFGLLRALGLGRGHLLLLVFCESLLLSLLAVAAGWLIGGGVHLWFSHHGLNLEALMGGSTAMMGTFMDPVIRTELSTERVIQLTAIVFGATMGSGIYPAVKASRVTPVEALRT
ncbi:ABC transporter permease [Guyparkeria sp.]|uniref:ABC transporter permease n=1 Tax=Guyparkeria sp. TaxID=2035736 RepID=UPI0039704DCE